MPCARDAGSVVPSSPAWPGPIDGSIDHLWRASRSRDPKTETKIEGAGRLVHLPAGRDLPGARGWNASGRPRRPQARPEDSPVSDGLGVCAAMTTIGACLTAWTMSSQCKMSMLWFRQDESCPVAGGGCDQTASNVNVGKRSPCRTRRSDIDASQSTCLVACMVLPALRVLFFV